MFFVFPLFLLNLSINRYFDLVERNQVTVDSLAVRKILALGFKMNGKGSHMPGETLLQLSAGDSLVLYSDGIIEARNSSGDEIGYERFQQMLQRNWSPDSERFYEAMLTEYQSWIGVEPAQDDMAMIFICRRD
ncbi:MAG: hypothetical protein GQF41_0748 [Candidatus Rifleibacterium amylolyticum]|nr:MAG: hypothetical protein GQF41_0748 [Candidatus Rifleibacterium amylolyticum]